MEEGALDPWHEFRSLYAKTAHQNLNEDEWRKLKEVMAELANAVLQASDGVISTAVQGQTGLLKGIVFEQVVMDEISVATHGELLCCWRGTEILTLIGDGQQLPATVLYSRPQHRTRSPMCRALGHSSAMD